jgi:transcriptional regulator with XRE-family HTH domain
LVYPGGADLHGPGVSMSGEAGNPHTGIEIGRTLRLAREKRDLSLKQVEEATKIRSRYLRDLENENFDVLPAVYVLGSLKTYAEHLGLDGAAMTTELKRRQSYLQPDQDQTREDPPSREPRGLVTSLVRLVGISRTVEDEAGTMAPVRKPGLYVSLVVVLGFVLATYLASSIRSEDLPPVSLVQEPTVSQLPSGVVLVGNVEDDERNSEDVGKENQPEKQTESPAKDDKSKAEQSRQEEYAPRTAQVPSSSATASANASAGASASAVPAYTGSASAPATVAPEPTRVRPEPAAGEGMVAPADPPARVSGSQGLHETQAGPVDATRRGDGVPNKVKKALDSAW